MIMLMVVTKVFEYLITFFQNTFNKKKYPKNQLIGKRIDVIAFWAIWCDLVIIETDWNRTIITQNIREI